MGQPDEWGNRMSRHRALDTARIVLLAAVLAAVGIAVWRNWSQVQAELGTLSWPALVGALLLVLASPLVTMLGWRELLADLGSRLHLAPAAGVFFVGQLGKYVPGSVWSVVAQAEMAGRLGIGRSRVAVTSLLFLGMATIAGGVLGLPALPVLLSRQQGEISPGWLLAAVALGVLLLAPPVLNRGVDVGLRLLRRPPLEHRLTGVTVSLASVLFALGWACTGLATAVLTRDLAPEVSWSQLLVVAVCGFSLAGVIGMVSFLVPAGVGVRDGVMLLLLGTVLSIPAATAVVVVVRFLTVVGDVVVAGFGWWWARRHALLPERLGHDSGEGHRGGQGREGGQGGEGREGGQGGEGREGGQSEQVDRGSS